MTMVANKIEKEVIGVITEVNKSNTKYGCSHRYDWERKNKDYAVIIRVFAKTDSYITSPMIEQLQEVVKPYTDKYFTDVNYGISTEFITKNGVENYAYKAVFEIMINK